MDGELDATPQVGAEGSDDSDLLSALSGDSDEQNADDNYDGVSVEPEEQAEAYTVKVNGVEKVVTKDELINGYQKVDAANQRFEEAAALRRENEQYRTSVAQHQEHLQQAINHFTSQAQQWAAQGEPNWNDLLENNPQEYLRQQHIYRERSAQYQQAQQAQAVLNQQRQAEADRQLQEYLKTEGPKILELIPEWRDENKRNSEVSEMYKFLTENGYTDQEIENFNYSKAKNFQMVVDAMRYRKLIEKTRSGKQQATNQVKPVPTISGINATSSKKDPTKMNDNEFSKWRKQQIANRR